MSVFKMTLAILQTLLMSTMAMASGDKGNGSDTVHCTDQYGVTNIKLLDYYEANTRYSPYKSANHGAERKIINASVVKAVAQFDSYRAKRLEDYFRLAETELELLGQNPTARTTLISFSDDPLNDLQDEGDLISIPKNCEIKQLIYRRKEISFNEARLVIFENDFNNLSPFQQSMALAHEFHYDDAIKFGEAKNSLEVRRINGLYYSELAKELNASKYFEYLQNSQSKELKKQFPYLVLFGQNVYQAYFVFSHEIENSRSLKNSFGLYPEGFYTSLPNDKPRLNINVPYYTKKKNNWISTVTRMSLSIIYEYNDGQKQGIAEAFAILNDKMFLENGYVDFCPERRLPLYAATRVKLIETQDQESVGIYRILAINYPKLKLDISIDGKKYNSSILNTKQISVKNNKFELSDIQTYDSDRD
jgi:hypothetical protein